ncbi:MAG: Gfo/Idh/MocA family oxidoreductase [Kiritimatiellaeota bacterium]|nr:Gfo/Idh/MocA family oxidoreductase [Kiritimatiellota bacterium]
MEKLRLGVVGTGSVVREIYRHLYFHSEYSNALSVEAACDPNEAALADFCDQYGIPNDRRFAGYEEMIASVGLDAVQVNTPDSLHRAPTVAAVEAGLDVLVPKPTAATVQDAHAMIDAARRNGRLLVVDFHKRQDPRIREAAARFRSGRYGSFQAAVWYMIDKLMVADPNHEPRFFASADFAEKNSPVSFLTVHMADALLAVVRERPVRVRAIGYKQKLPSLSPIPVDGFDLVDTEIRFETGAVAHVITGWHLPNGAHATTVQEARIICSEGLIDLSLDRPGYYELSPEGIQEVNPLFRNFEEDGRVTGYGISSPGRLLWAIGRHCRGEMDQAEYKRLMSPGVLGFDTTLVLEGAERSLALGTQNDSGVISGPEVDLNEILDRQIGEAARQYRSTGA